MSASSNHFSLQSGEHSEGGSVTAALINRSQIGSSPMANMNEKTAATNNTVELPKNNFSAGPNIEKRKTDPEFSFHYEFITNVSTFKL